MSDKKLSARRVALAKNVATALILAGVVGFLYAMFLVHVVLGVAVSGVALLAVGLALYAAVIDLVLKRGIEK